MAPRAEYKANIEHFQQGGEDEVAEGDGLIDSLPVKTTDTQEIKSAIYGLCSW